MEVDNALNTGSQWARWDPHLHAPGTLLNDQFESDRPWGDYITAIETSQPPIRVLGVTDYYLTGSYQRVVEEKGRGRLSRVELIFPNVEVRLDVGTVKRKWVNLHLLVCPDDPDHVEQLHRFLARLSFRAFDDSFACSETDLARLGKAADPDIVDHRAAVRYGASQFKVSFNQLREEFDKSAWAKSNILTAVAGGKADGTSGVRGASDKTLREEIEKWADVIFASSPSQREFWLGRRAVPEADLRARYGGLKPCLHGSDCHDHSRIGAPDEDRFCWLKGGFEFDTLRQACIDPANRAMVGSDPPIAGTPSQSIARLEVLGTNWPGTHAVAFNPGMVAIIGPRGSGKTALADMVAIACDSIPEGDRSSAPYPSASFLTRAADLLEGVTATVHWRAGDPTTRALDGTDTPAFAHPRARYLSQQFVEELCSATGVTDELLREIERVIFESHPVEDRDGALDFEELLELRATRLRRAREREEKAIQQLSERIGDELEKDRQLPELRQQIEGKKELIKAYTADRAKLVPEGSEKRAARLADLATAAETVRGYLRFFKKQEQALLALRDEVKDLRQNKAPEMLRASQERHAASRMGPEAWQPFLIDYTGDVDVQLQTHLQKATESLASWKGAPPEPGSDSQDPLIADDAPLDEQPLALLEAEIERLQRFVNADVVAQRSFRALSTKIANETAALQTLLDKLKGAEAAKQKARELQDEREEAYRRVFDAIVREQEVLTELYEPLVTRIGASSGTLTKLRFTVSRTADVAAWARVVEEELVDLRRQGPFKGKGNFQTLAEEIMKEPWEEGTPNEVAEAMRNFRSRYNDDLLAHANVPKAEHSGYRAWLKRFAMWLFSTDHIRLTYGISYEGVDIRKLSPGTRGIVLLLLYLALDDADDRPLIIDQPEENLDPKSVFDELVGLFVQARTRRQVIIVTHNANLVVNTDSDQVIVADAGPHSSGQLPTITWRSGGLENRATRRAVCDILEGGEHAFQERARRLRVTLPALF